MIQIPVRRRRFTSEVRSARVPLQPLPAFVKVRHRAPRTEVGWRTTTVSTFWEDGAKPLSYRELLVFVLLEHRHLTNRRTEPGHHRFRPRAPTLERFVKGL